MAGCFTSTLSSVEMTIYGEYKRKQLPMKRVLPQTLTSIDT